LARGGLAVTRDKRLERLKRFKSAAFVIIPFVLYLTPPPLLLNRRRVRERII